MAEECTPQTVRVLVVDDHRLIRQELRNILSFYREFKVVGEAADGVQAYELAQQLQPDVILMDVHMPKMTGSRRRNGSRQCCPTSPLSGSRSTRASLPFMK